MADETLTPEQAAAKTEWDKYGVKPTGQPAPWNLYRGGPRYRAATGKSEPDLGQTTKWAAKDEFGTDKPEEIAKAITLEQLGQYRTRPEQFGLSEAEKQAAADKAAAASGAQAATALTQAARAMKGGGMTGYASQAMREATAPGRQAAATASQQALEASRGMIEQKGQDLYGQLTGLPARQPNVWDQAAAAAATEAMMSGADIGFEYMDQNLLSQDTDPKGNYFDPAANKPEVTKP